MQTWNAARHDSIPEKKVRQMEVKLRSRLFTMTTPSTTHKCAEDEEDHEETTESCLAVDVSVADGRHGDQREVDALPVGQLPVFFGVGYRILRILDLAFSQYTNISSQSAKP